MDLHGVTVTHQSGEVAANFFDTGHDDTSTGVHGELLEAVLCRNQKRHKTNCLTTVDRGESPVWGLKSCRVPGTSQKDGVSVLCVAGLQLHDAANVWRLTAHHVAVMIRKQFDDLPLLIS